jgi:hypothetical protein
VSKTKGSAIANGYIVVYIRPSMRGVLHPITAFIGGTQVEGSGPTVVEAIEDLFTDATAGRLCRKLEAEVAARLATGAYPDRRAR